MKRAYFAGGCFWCMTPVFRARGAASVRSGYSGGDEASPSYEDVKAQRTGHRETVEVVYDQGVLPYSVLLDIFFANIDPFDGEGQFIDRGASYSPAVFYQTEEERTMALAKIGDIERESGRQVEVALLPFRNFWPAEEYHQNYDLKNPEAFAEELKISGRLKKNS